MYHSSASSVTKRPAMPATKRYAGGGGHAEAGWTGAFEKLAVLVGR
jgi:hypothetical protein